MTRFKVSEEALGDGKDVRCGECQHVWFQTPPDGDDISVEEGTTKPVIHENTFDEELAEAVVDVPDAIAPDTGSGALTIEDEEGKVISTKTAVTVFASLLIITIGVLVALQSSIVKIWPKTESFYKAVALDTKHPWDGLKMTNAYATYRDDKDVGKLLYVEVEIMNITDQPIQLPNVQVDFKDSETNDVIKTWHPDVQATELTPGQVHPIKLGFTDFVRDKGYVKLSFSYRDE
jgi:predicted Zn finger-like uncharacterized protein